MCKDCGCGSTGNVTTKLFHVPGMMCGNCENTVNGAVRGLPGVLESTVDSKTPGNPRTAPFTVFSQFTHIMPGT